MEIAPPRMYTAMATGFPIPGFNNADTRRLRGGELESKIKADEEFCEKGEEESYMANFFAQREDSGNEFFEYRLENSMFDL